ncbi:MAG: Gx transporter family protein [Clostridia bacterium]
MTGSRIDAKRIATVAMLSAMALAVQYFESLLPPIVPGIPVRIGLANLFVLFALLTGHKADAAFVSLLRCLLYPLITGNISGLAYAVVGSLLGYLGMLLLLPLYHKDAVGAVGISVLGAFLFNVGQLLVGIFVVGTAMTVYFPWMGLLSIPAGICTGLLAKMLVRRVPLT